MVFENVPVLSVCGELFSIQWLLKMNPCKVVLGMFLYSVAIESDWV